MLILLLFFDNYFKVDIDSLICLCAVLLFVGTYNDDNQQDKIRDVYCKLCKQTDELGVYVAHCCGRDNKRNNVEETTMEAVMLPA